MKTARPDNECPVCSEPTQTASGELTGNPHSPDCDYLKPPYIPPAELPDFSRLPEMAPTRMNLLESEQNSLAYRLDTLEAFLDFDPKAPASDALPDDIHQLIAEGMTIATTHCMESAAALVTVLGTATDKRIDAVVQQADLLQSLLLNVKELLLNVDARLNALEVKAPC